ncbi:uncharacterized protein J8A68_000482 [[Candida] subhashii]|uniref:Uncharacterized protein n=1 Tax=[Candida] subhashii TaxID=561895 RepID=A0A8J5QWK1_9ASCO|nr:uncharacterized protein J8A68_000482 [[Candida] subhashii]KAG7666052.1 hypothetical protein J8A68_000482 [[Candida] subhashii]
MIRGKGPTFQISENEGKSNLWSLQEASTIRFSEMIRLIIRSKIAKSENVINGDTGSFAVEEKWEIETALGGRI